MSREPLENPDVVVQRPTHAAEATRVVSPTTVKGETWSLTALAVYPRRSRGWVLPNTEVEKVLTGARSAGLVARELGAP